MMPGSDPGMLMSSGQNHQDLPATHSPQMRTVTEFLNSNHPLVVTLRAKLASKGPLPSSPSSSGGKSESDAEFLINRGHHEFRSKKYGEALQSCSQSIAAAPIGGKALACAFAIRSEVLFIRRRYDLCLLDINRALSAGNDVLPEDCKQELLDRRRQSLTEMKRMNYSQIFAMAAEKLRPGAQPPRTVYERQVLYYHNNGFYEINNVDETDLKMDDRIFDDSIWRTQFANNGSLPGVSSKIALKKDHPSNGMQLIAQEDINPGEELLIREYLMVLTIPFKHYTFCAYCALWCEALIPCPTCTLEMYCSESCRLEAYGLYHRTECKVSGMLRRGDNGEPSISSISLRLFLTGTGQGAELAKLMNDPNVSALMNATTFQGVGLPDEYVSDSNYYKYLATLNTLYRICRDDEYVVHCSEILFDDVILIINALRSINFFNEEESSSLTYEDRGSTSNNLEIFAALLLLQHMRIWTTQCAEMLQFELFEEIAYEPSEIRHEVGYSGVGVGNWGNLMTHSCDPNTALVQDRRRSLVYSTRLIRRGELICRASDPTQTYAYENREKRKQKLEEREIICSCKACEDNWPVKEKLLMRRHVYLIPDQEKIDLIEEMETILFRRETGLSLPKQFLEVLAKKVRAFIRTIRTYVEEPCAIILLSEEYLQDLMRVRGNFYVTYKT